MDSIILDVFAKKYIVPIQLDELDPAFPNRIAGISCIYCGTKFTHDADLMISHLQHKHGLSIKEIVPSIK